MSTAEIDTTRRWMWVFGVVFSVTILALGLWLSLATGEWIALLCASGLVALPVGGVALRSRRSR
jgi:hypothetical protein